MDWIMYFSYLLFLGLTLAAFCTRTGRHALALAFMIVTSIVCSILHGALKEVSA